MLELLKKTYLMGLGLTTVTREKLEEIVDELIKRGEIAEQDRTHVLQDLLDKAREQQQRLGQTIRENVRKVVQELGLPTRTQFQELERRVKALEDKLGVSGPAEQSDASSATDS